MRGRHTRCTWETRTRIDRMSVISPANGLMVHLTQGRPQPQNGPRHPAQRKTQLSPASCPLRTDDTTAFACYRRRTIQYWASMTSVRGVVSSQVGARRLRDRFRVLALAVYCSSAVYPQGQPEDKKIRIRNLEDQIFSSMPAGFPACMSSSLQHGDPSHGPTIAVVRLNTGCTIPWHWHTSEEQIMLFKGSGRFQAKGSAPVMLKSGGYVFVPSHVVERFTCSESCTIFLHTNLVSDIHYVDAGGHEISLEKALALEKGVSSQATKE